MTIDITTRNLLISLCSHMAYMQGQLEALHQLDDPDNYYWFRESVALRQKVADHLATMADGPAVPPPTVMEIIELSEEVEAAGLGQVDFARAVLARWGKAAPVPVAVSERPWEREEWCDTDGLCWLGGNAFDGSTPTWLYGSPAWAERFQNVYRVLLPAHALPLPEVGE